MPVAIGSAACRLYVVKYSVYCTKTMGWREKMMSYLFLHLPPAQPPLAHQELHHPYDMARRESGIIPTSVQTAFRLCAPRVGTTGRRHMDSCGGPPQCASPRSPSPEHGSEKLRSPRTTRIFPNRFRSIQGTRGDVSSNCSWRKGRNGGGGRFLNVCCQPPD